MAGMAKRGTHTPRHRAGRARPDAAEPDAPQSDTGKQDAPLPRRLRSGGAWPGAPTADLPAPDWPAPAPPPTADLSPEVRGSDGMAHGHAPDADIGYEAMAWKGAGPSQVAPRVMPPSA